MTIEEFQGLDTYEQLIELIDFGGEILSSMHRLSTLAEDFEKYALMTMECFVVMEITSLNVESILGSIHGHGSPYLAIAGSISDIVDIRDCALRLAVLDGYDGRSFEEGMAYYERLSRCEMLWMMDSGYMTHDHLDKLADMSDIHRKIFDTPVDDIDLDTLEDINDKLDDLSRDYPEE